jgi:hypothetical protein
MGIASMVFVVRLSDETTIASTNLTKSVADLDKSTKEIQRVEGLNSTLQAELLSQSKTITELSYQGLNTATGGDSFAYVEFLSYLPHRNTPLVISRGNYPLYGVTARVVDLGVPEPKIVPSDDPERTRESARLFDSYRKSAETTLSIGDMPIKSSWLPPGELSELPFDPSHGNFNIFFSARNGFWHEVYRSVGEPGHRVSAIRVFMVSRAGKEKVVYEKVDEAFPRDEHGVPNWGIPPD